MKEDCKERRVTNTKLLAVATAVALFLGGGHVVAAEGSSHNSQTVQQQVQTIRGTVVDTHGEPVIGANVVEKGTTNGGVTDIDGNFSLRVAPGSIIQISFMGYQTQELKATSNMKVVLAEDTELLDEVVVTAMGIKKEKKALGYSVQDVNSEELMKNKSANVINSLAGKVAGVNITQGSGAAGAGSQIIIRGGTSLERDNQPLFVVDGIIYDNSTDGGNSLFEGSTRTNTTHSNRVMDINPEDVESMSVLKGPAAAALYGSRAAAGVVIITTKRGKEGAVQVNLNSKVSASWANRLPELQDKYKRGQYNDRGILQEDLILDSWGAPFAEGETVYDNLGEFFRTGVTWDNSVSVSGGSKNGSFYLSTSRFKQDGIIPETAYTKNTFRFNGEQKYGKLTVGANVAFSVADNDQALTSGGLYGIGGSGAVSTAYRWPRSEDMSHWLNEDGTKYRLFPGQLLASDVDNPYWVLNKNKGAEKTTRFTGSLNFKFDVTDWFNLSYTAGIDRYDTQANRLIEPGSGYPILYQKGLLTENDRVYEYLQSNFMANFHKQFGDFDFNLLLGNSIEDTKSRVNYRKAWNFTVDNFFNINNTADADRNISQGNSRKRLVGTFGEFRVGYKSIAYVTVTGRNDWTSTLPVENNSYFYPSVSGAFVFTELLPQNDILSFGKVRASWARVGKDANPYVTNTYLDPPFAVIGNQQGIENAWTHGNETLIPETTESTEVGLEMRFLKGRLGFDFTYYTNKSYNQLLQPRTSNASGYILMTTNAGDITNKGIELSINAQPIVTRDFSWDLTLNMSRNKGKVNNLLPGIDILYVTDVQVGNAKAASFNNGNFMAISGSKWERDPQGRVILNPQTGMPLNDGATTHEIANREPKLQGGLNSSLQWKNWNLSFLLDFRIGGAVYNGTDYALTTLGMSKLSENREVLDISGVIEESEGVYVPKTFHFEANKFYNLNDYGQEVASDDPNALSGHSIIRGYWSGYYGTETANFITDTNWLRLRSISLSYDFPKTLLAKTKFIKGLTATLTGTNLFVWTNYKGLDPEITAAGAGAVGSSSVGIDYYGVPSTAGVSFGVNVTF